MYCGEVLPRAATSEQQCLFELVHTGESIYVIETAAPASVPCLAAAEVSLAALGGRAGLVAPGGWADMVLWKLDGAEQVPYCGYTFD